MVSALLTIPRPENEPVLNYEPGSAERVALAARAKQMLGEQIEIPLLIGGKRVHTGKLKECVCPHDHGHVLARYHVASAEEVAMAIKAAAAAHGPWTSMPWRSRAAVFRKAADLIATKYRATLNAATMLGQSKTAHQAEIDAACELIDFLRFNAHFASTLVADQPASPLGIWNYVDHRPLEGFVFAVTPFNFTAIAGNLPTAPAMMANTVLWKPASSAVYSAWHVMQILEEAGLPPGVINFIPGPGSEVGKSAMQSPDLAGVHFTGSTAVFQNMWKTVGDNIQSYRSYPRIVGETGGKDFIVAHPSADPEALATACLRGAYEYQGQKCSAASRLYLPESLHQQVRDQIVDELQTMKMGNPLDFQNFLGAVIDRGAFSEIKGYIEYARQASDAEIVAGGQCDDSEGFFIRPTLVRAQRPDFKLMQEEIFGPVLTYYVYPDAEYEETLQICDQTSPYALTGAVFARDRRAIDVTMDRLRFAAGNFYVNDKPTGAVVGQQPFGGGRASGTNDKAGSVLNLLRWVSPRTVKENFIPPVDYRYPFMQQD